MMDSLLRKVVENRDVESVKRYFLRFGKGKYERRFMISFNKGKRIKIKGSFEWANDFVEFVMSAVDDLKFSGKVMNLEKVSKLNGRKKGNSFVYEIKDSDLSEFKKPYFYLVDFKSDDVILKIKKNIPKPGKSVNKIDDKFCSLDLDLKYWDKIKELLFWDVPSVDTKKKVQIEHTLEITHIEIPNGVGAEDARDRAIRKGKLIRKMDLDGDVKIIDYPLRV